MARLISAPTLRGEAPRQIAFGGSVAVPAYSVLLALGCLGGLVLGAATTSAHLVGVGSFVVAASLLLAPAILGARALFVAMNWSYFRAHPRAVTDRQGGGSALYGGLLLAFMLSLALLPLMDVPVWRFWDAASVTMLVGLAVTRVGCLVNGCCGGRPTARWFGLRLPDHGGHWERRVPTQLVEAAGAMAAVGGVLWIDAESPSPGTTFILVVGAYAAVRLLLEPMRAPAAGRRANLAISAALLITAAAAVGLA